MVQSLDLANDNDAWDEFSSGPGRYHETYEGDHLLLPELSILGWLRFFKAFDNALEADEHEDEFEIHYIVSGELNWWVRKTSYRLRAGTVLVVRPGELHGSNTGVLEPCEHYWLRIKLSKDNVLPGLSLEDSNQFFKNMMDFQTRAFKGSEVIREAFVQLMEEQKNKQDYSTLVSRSALHIMLSQLVRDHDDFIQSQGEERKMISPPIQKVIHEIQDNLDYPPSVESLAVLAGMSETAFSKKFRVEVGCSPHDYMTHRRIKEAKKLLANSDQNIIDVAFALGFSTSQYFATVFKRRVGITPKQYREQKQA